MIYQILDFLFDPFGIAKRRRKTEIKNMIQQMNDHSKKIDKAIAEKDYMQAGRLINNFKIFID